MIVFEIISTVTFYALHVIWSTSSWLNSFLKLFFGVMTLYGLFVILVQYGFLIKTL